MKNLMIKAKALDQFFTKPEVANACVCEVKKYLTSKNIKPTLFLEPSAGAGAFINAVKEMFPEAPLVAGDIQVQCEGVIEEDFLTKDTTVMEAEKGVIVVGNPPFGKNSSLAIKFFNKSAKFAEIIAFIVPKTFKKPSVINKLDANFHLVYESDIPNMSFLVLNNETDVPCVFQIWEKRNIQREKIVLDKVSKDYDFVSRQEANWAFQRVGVKAGTLKGKEKFEHIADASHMFMKFHNEDDAIIFSLIDWTDVKYNTAGNPSISKGEMKAEYEKTKSQCVSLLKYMNCNLIGDFKNVFELKEAALFEDENGIYKIKLLENGNLVCLDVNKGVYDMYQSYSCEYNGRMYSFTLLNY